ncbi:MAG: hypothetical protein AAGG51_25195 [Cyanobacteria bacterium P01_G01_bin.54]
METFQPYLTYLGIGLGGIMAIAALVWIAATIAFTRRTWGLNRFLVSFFKTLTQNNLKAAYSLTTANFQAENNLRDFRKFVKRNKLTQYQKLSATVPELMGGEVFRLNLMVKLAGDRELPMVVVVSKDVQKAWQLEALDV